MRGGRLLELDFWRCALGDDAARFKEWHHFLIVKDELTVLVNFSVDVRGSRRDAKTIILVHRENWRGVLVEHDGGAQFENGGARAKFGEDIFEIRAGDFRVKIENSDCGLSADLSLTPELAPIVARNQILSPGRRLHWILFGRMKVRGTMFIDDISIDVTGADAYHDHNWGSFSWGEDFSWEWSTVFATHRGEPWTVVYSCLQDRARSRVALQQFFAWRAGENIVAARQSAIRVEQTSGVEESNIFRLPAVMGLLVPKTLRHVPGALRIGASQGKIELEVILELSRPAQILLPSEVHPLRVTQLNELAGRARLAGRIGEEVIDVAGRCIFELAC